jgi:hypothetical protein
MSHRLLFRASHVPTAFSRAERDLKKFGTSFGPDLNGGSRPEHRLEAYATLIFRILSRDVPKVSGARESRAHYDRLRVILARKPPADHPA